MENTKYLRVALLLVGLIFIFGIYPLTILWPSGWAWHTGGHSDYLQMILGTYATLGVFLVIASLNPLARRSLIWFTVWSSIVHGVIMAAQAIYNTQQIGHLWGDVAAFGIPRRFGDYSAGVRHSLRGSFDRSSRTQLCSVHRGIGFTGA